MCVESLSTEELAVLQTIFDHACRQLGLTEASPDGPRREHLAMVIVSLLQEGHCIDVVTIQHQAVFQMRHPN